MIIDLSMFAWNKNTKVLTASSEALCISGYPNELVVMNYKTGNSFKFVTDVEKAIACEFWDGEESHMKPVDPDCPVKEVVIHSYF